MRTTDCLVCGHTVPCPDHSPKQRKGFMTCSVCKVTTHMSELSSQDAALLEQALEIDNIGDGAKKAFEDMLHRGHALSDKQRAWLESALEGRRYEPEPEYENAWSAGKVPEGRPVETPAVLRNLPKRPPERL